MVPNVKGPLVGDPRRGSGLNNPLDLISDRVFPTVLLVYFYVLQVNFN